MEIKNSEFDGLENALSSDELNELNAGRKPEVIDEQLASKDGDGYAFQCCNRPEED